MKKICIGVLFCMSAFVCAQSFDLVSRPWTALADESPSTVSPADPDALIQTVDGKRAVKAVFNIGPDKDNGGKIWTWGELGANFRDDESGVDLSKVSKATLTYASKGEHTLTIVMTQGVLEEGSDHCIEIKPTGGKIETTTFSLKDFKQPSWTGKKARLKLNAIKRMAFQTAMPKGGETELTVYSMVFEGWDGK